MKSHLLAPLTLIAAIGCASLSPEEKSVRIVNSLEQVRGCRDAGDIEIDGFDHASTASTWRAFKKKVVSAGGNTGYVVSVSGGGNHPNIIGTAYRCGQPAP
jgi:hypothetical protein